MSASSETFEEGTIMDLLLADPVDLVLLRRISRQPGGFLTNGVRDRAWAKILQVNRYGRVSNLNLACSLLSPFDQIRNRESL